MARRASPDPRSRSIQMQQKGQDPRQPVIYGRQGSVRDRSDYVNGVNITQPPPIEWGALEARFGRLLTERPR
jgi:hypothetical protein